MVTDYCSEKRSSYGSLAVLVYLVINIRVEAGFATPPERILDGLVALSVFLLMLYIGMRFFNVIKDDDNVSMVLLRSGKGVL